MQMTYKVNYEETMPLEEKLKIGMRSFELDGQGRHEEASRMRRQIPLSPHMALWAKKRMGADFLIQSGWNLDEADLAYGPGWLNK
jgi:hypothetical protein